MYVKNLIESYGIPVVERHGSVTDPDAFMSYVSKLRGVEGFVVRWNDGFRVKIKADEYVQIHKAKEKILYDNNIVGLILSSQLDDIKAHLSDAENQKLTKFESDINHQLVDLAEAVERAVKTERKICDGDRKTFAISRAQYYPALTKRLIFAMWDNCTYDESMSRVVDIVKSSINRNSKWIDLRDQWFAGIQYND